MLILAKQVFCLIYDTVNQYVLSTVLAGDGIKALGNIGNLANACHVVKICHVVSDC